MFTADPDHMDNILQREWNSVHQGNSVDHVRTVLEFVGNYWQYFYKAPSVILEPFTGEQLREACLGASNSAAGMDSWSPAD